MWLYRQLQQSSWRILRFRGTTSSLVNLLGFSDLSYCLRFASIIVMLKRLTTIKKGLLTLVISEQWYEYREDDVQKEAFVKETILNDQWWDKVDYILRFTGPIYDMFRSCDTDESNLHLVYEKWGSMIEKVKLEIYNQEGKELSQNSSSYDVVYNILIARWTKSHTPLHCLAHSLNPRKSKNYNEGETKMWDIGGDECSLSDGAGILEVVSLSLDEPNMEAILLQKTGKEIVTLTLLECDFYIHA
ncbi:hypothetical protein KIW84_054870 [Lathyrus oleraceus]|uniref:Uncharacterized protein n=1 Tax=Pisum sativum TaxID=3888 RepID=A0A9D4WZ63_PEA|nr:hypothetical protein KIW84_054870 [Pisum sativum]